MDQNSNNIKSGLSWHVVEEKINCEIKWLKDAISLWNQETPFTLLDVKGSEINCECNYRKIALLIIKGIIKAKEINGKYLWGEQNKINDVISKHRHGKDWHNKMMTIVASFFELQGYKVIIEPYLNWGRADFGMTPEFRTQSSI